MIRAHLDSGAELTGMLNLTALSANVAAAVDKTKLDLTDLSLLKTYPQSSCNGYSAAEKVCPQKIAIGEIMREAARILA